MSVFIIMSIKEVRISIAKKTTVEISKTIADNNKGIRNPLFLLI